MSIWIGMGSPPHGETAGIYRATFNSETGEIGWPELVAPIQSPGFLTFSRDGRVLYSLCAGDDGQGGVASFRLSDDGKSLTLLSKQPTGDGRPAHLALDASERCLFSAQYGNSSICVYPVSAEGKIGSRSQHIRHEGSGPNASRQDAPHPHWVGTDPTNHFLFVPDLGIDQITIYRLDPESAQLQRHGQAQVSPGAGPRHMKFHPNGACAYVVNELDLSVSAFRYDASAGQLHEIQTISTLPEELREVPNTGSEVQIHPSGKYLYAGNRGHDSIAVFSIDSDSGRLSFVEREAVRGSHPRHFNLDPSGKWLVAAGRDSNTISVFRIDDKDGSLVYSGRTVNSPAPICIEFQPHPESQ